MQEYFFVFLILFFFSFLDVFFRSKWASVYFLIPLTIVIFFVGFRWETGNDWIPYFDYYQWLNDVADKSDSFEVGFRYVAYFFKSIGFEYIYFLFFITGLYIISFSISFVSTRRPSLLLFIFYSTYLLGFMGTLRQTIAISICLISFVFIYKGKKLLPITLILFASLFHVTAFFCFIALFVPKKLIGKNVFLYVSLISVLFYYFDVVGLLLQFLLKYATGLDFLYNRLVTYSQVQSSDLYGNGDLALVLGSIKRVSLAFMFWLFLQRLKAEVDYVGYFFNLYFVSVVLYLLFQGPLLMIALRGTLYFAFLEIFLIASLCYAVKDFFVKFGFFIIISVYMFGRLYSAVNSYHPDLFLPYKSIFYNQEVKKMLY